MATRRHPRHAGCSACRVPGCSKGMKLSWRLPTTGLLAALEAPVMMFVQGDRQQLLTSSCLLLFLFLI